MAGASGEKLLNKDGGALGQGVGRGSSGPWATKDKHPPQGGTRETPRKIVSAKAVDMGSAQ